MIALIDSDLVAYRCAASCKEEDPLDVALYRVDKLMREILEMTGATEYKAFLTGSDNFRKVINPDYKANRKDMQPPAFLQDCREYLVSEWKAKLSHGQEADDELGIYQDIKEDTIICSLDKDLLMIPGQHFNWTKQQYGDYTYVTEMEGNKHFWKQVLAGDRSDNIFGFDGIARATIPKFIQKIIDPLKTDQECLEIVLEKYNDDYKRFVMNASCLWIKRHEESEWHSDLNLILTNELKQEVDQITEFMKSFKIGI